MTLPIRFNKIYVILLALSLFLFTTACNRSKPESTQELARGVGTAEYAGLRPLEVSAAESISRQIPTFIQVTGSFVADESSDVTPQTSGQVIATPIDVGTFVEQGEVILVLDDRDAKLRLQQAQAAEQQAVAAVRQAESKLGLESGKRFDATKIPEVQAAHAAYELVQAEAKLAEVNANRYAKLLEPGYVSRSIYDQAITQAEIARARAEAAREQYEAALNTARQDHQGIERAQASLAEAKAQVAIAQKAVADTILKAPLSGYVSARYVSVGEYVTPASKILTIQRISPIKLQLQAPEAEAGRVRIGMPVSAWVVAYPDKELIGTVTTINPVIDLSSRTLTIEVKIDNSDGLIRPGMFATARLVQPIGQEAVFIPSTALIKDSTMSSARVFVLEGNTARVRVVQVGEQENGMVRVLSGLSGGEWVATSNLAQLYDGARVQHTQLERQVIVVN